MHHNIYCDLYTVGEDSGQSSPENKISQVYTFKKKKLNYMGGQN